MQNRFENICHVIRAYCRGRHQRSNFFIESILFALVFELQKLCPVSNLRRLPNPCLAPFGRLSKSLVNPGQEPQRSKTFLALLKSGVGTSYRRHPYTERNLFHLTKYVVVIGLTRSECRETSPIEYDGLMNIHLSNLFIPQSCPSLARHRKA